MLRYNVTCAIVDDTGSKRLHACYALQQWNKYEHLAKKVAEATFILAAPINANLECNQPPPAFPHHSF